MLDGEKVICKGVYQNGINYIQLRDLDKPLDLASVTWNSKLGIPILTRKSKEVMK